jgi:cell division protein FtsI/penicillin-binding protein 2
MLASVVARGTGREAGVPGYAIAAKTGTARKVQPNGTYEDEEGLYHYASTVVGYFPAAAPELSMIVIIDDPIDQFYASETAAPLFGDIASWALRHYKISPSSDLVYSVASQNNSNNQIPDGSDSEVVQ